jgi:hypothetical protein
MHFLDVTSRRPTCSCRTVRRAVVRDSACPLHGDPLAAAQPRGPTDTNRVRDVLRGRLRWFTARRLADRTGLPVSRVNAALCSLVARGEVRRLLSVDEGRRGHGQQYRWRDV